MKSVQQFVVKKAKTKGRICITLENDDGPFQAWLSPEQAELLAAQILTAQAVTLFAVVAFIWRGRRPATCYNPMLP